MTEVTDEQRRDPAQWARLLADGDFIMVPTIEGSMHVWLTEGGGLSVFTDGELETAANAEAHFLMIAVLEALEIRRIDGGRALLVRRLKAAGWTCERICASHDVWKPAGSRHCLDVHVPKGPKTTKYRWLLRSAHRCLDRNGVPNV